MPKSWRVVIFLTFWIPSAGKATSSHTAGQDAYMAYLNACQGGNGSACGEIERINRDAAHYAHQNGTDATTALNQVLDARADGTQPKWEEGAPPPPREGNRPPWGGEARGPRGPEGPRPPPGLAPRPPRP